jgi:membrane fusion protein, multidrug efflux system
MPDQPPSPALAFQAGGGSPAKSSRRWRTWLSWLVIGAVVAVIGYALVVRSSDRRPAGRSRAGDAGSALPVTAEPAHQADLDLRIVALGTVTPVATVTVRSRVDGELQKLFFKEGEKVEAGAPLADLDARPFEVLKLQGEAQLAKDNALLENARVDLKRFQTLLAEDSVAEQQVVTQAALVRQYEASTKVDQAQVQSADLQLAYAHITAPITGRIGLRYVDQGNIVHASDATGLAVITQLHPITVLFSVPQDSVPQVIKRFDAAGQPMEVQAFDRDGHTLLATGKLVTVDNQIDPTTGTVKLRAEFPNADDALFPNQFVNVQVVVDQLKDATVVPTAAVQRGTAGTFVYVVGPEKKASVRAVETGPTEKGMIVVSKGIAAGEIVVVDGVDKLREGSAVELISREGATPAAPNAATKPDRPPGKRAHPGATPATPAKN